MAEEEVVEAEGRGFGGEARAGGGEGADEEAGGGVHVALRVW